MRNQIQQPPFHSLIRNAGRDSKEAVADTVANRVVAAKRAVKQGRRAAEDLVDGSEYRIKQRPFSALGVSFGIGMGLGAAIGVLLARNGRCGKSPTPSKSLR